VYENEVRQLYAMLFESGRRSSTTMPKRWNKRRLHDLLVYERDR
jgi:hypothetical protein